jgi:hypothetical protein
MVMGKNGHVVGHIRMLPDMDPSLECPVEDDIRPDADCPVEIDMLGVAVPKVAEKP